MSPVKLILTGAITLFLVIGAVSFFKNRGKSEKNISLAGMENRQEIILQQQHKPDVQVKPLISKKADPEPLYKPVEGKKPVIEGKPEKTEPLETDFADVDLIQRFFSLDSSKLPIVETVTYSSRVPWLKGRPAWIADYASYYSTSRHFIARSLNRKPDYFTQKIGPGDKFNVFRKDKEFQFYLLIDLSRCKMWFYYYDLANQERVLLKTYNVGLGRKDPDKSSGSLTPIGKYTLGSKIAIYKPGSMGYFQEKKTEMIQIFGTRWIPFDQEVGSCSEPSRGYGLHGSPWLATSQGELIEDQAHIGKYDSDGCIRLNAEDIEELFSIIITKPTTVELVKDFHEATPPGVVKKLP